jgi:DNA adenine methylase
MIRPVFKSHGGKHYLKHWIISNFPPDYRDRVYIEGCGGAASVLLNKPRSRREIYNDADPGIARIFQALASKSADDLVVAIANTPYTEEIFLQSKSKDDALSEIVKRRMSRGGLRESFAWSNRLRGGQPGDLNAWETFKKETHKITERLRGVQIYNESVIDLFKRLDCDDVFWYLDPPYLPETRKSRQAYEVEMTREEHVALAGLLNNAKGKVLLSGYNSGLYEEFYRGWSTATKQIVNHSGQNKTKQKRVEWLWANYELPGGME